MAQLSHRAVINDLPVYDQCSLRWNYLTELQLLQSHCSVWKLVLTAHVHIFIHKHTMIAVFVNASLVPCHLLETEYLHNTHSIYYGEVKLYLYKSSHNT